MKDLSLLMSGRSLKDIILVDNKVCSYLINIENGIPVKNFLGDKSDNTLQMLTRYLKEKLLEAEDVREVIKKDFMDQDKINDKKFQYNLL